MTVKKILKAFKPYIGQNISANIQVTRHVYFEISGYSDNYKIDTSSESIYKYTLLLFSSTVILQIINNNVPHILVAYYGRSCANAICKYYLIFKNKKE